MCVCANFLLFIFLILQSRKNKNGLENKKWISNIFRLKSLSLSFSLSLPLFLLWNTQFTAQNSVKWCVRTDRELRTVFWFCLYGIGHLARRSCMRDKHVVYTDIYRMLSGIHLTVYVIFGWCVMVNSAHRAHQIIWYRNGRAWWESWVRGPLQN